MTTTPFPAARPSSLTTYGEPHRVSASSISAADVTLTAAAVGTPAAAITSFANAFDPSIRAAAAFGPKTGMPAHRQLVGGAVDQRNLRPDDDQVGPDPLGEVGDGRRVGDIDGVGGRQRAGPGVAGRDVQVANAGVAAQRPQQGMFASTGANDENAHVGQSIGPT